jgi:hypothetical protein
VLSQSGDLELSAVNANVRHNVERLRHAGPILVDLVDRDELRVVGGIYDRATDKVERVKARRARNVAIPGILPCSRTLRGLGRAGARSDPLGATGARGPQAERWRCFTFVVIEILRSQPL